MKSPLTVKTTEVVVRIDHLATGAALRASRKKAGITLTEIGKRTGLSRPYIHDLETGRRNWSAELVAKFNTALDPRP